MQFIIEKTKRGKCTWRLVGTIGTLARAPEDYGSPSLCRASIAQFRRSSSGVRFAKVVDLT